MYIIPSGMKIKCFYFLASEMSESSDEDGIIDNKTNFSDSASNYYFDKILLPSLLI